MLPTELVARELGLVLVALEGRGLDQSTVGGLERVQDPLAALAGLVQHKQREVVVMVGHHRGDVVEQGVVGLVQVMHDQRPRSPEQRRACLDGELTRDVAGRLDVGHLQIGGTDPDLVQRRCHSSLDQHLLGPLDQHQGWDASRLAHAVSLPRSTDGHDLHQALQWGHADDLVAPARFRGD